MAVSLVYLTYLCQFTLDNDGNSGARAAAAGACMLIIVQVSINGFLPETCLHQAKKITFT